MSLKRHARTRVTVVRAGDTTTLVSLEDWYGGQLLAPADTQIIEALTGKLRWQLPRTQLWVMARLTAQSAEDLTCGSGSPAGMRAAIEQPDPRHQQLWSHTEHFSWRVE